MDYFTFAADDEDEGIRIDSFLSSEIDEISRSMIQKLIEKEFIKVNSKTISKNYRLRKNDYIEVTVPKPKTVDIKPENIDIEIVYEDSDIIVVNKPQGMVVHPALGHYSGTVVNALMYHCPNGLSGINGEMRPGIVHRIDKDTSGIIVAAKNDFAHKNLSIQFAKHSINRVYQAVVFNNIKEEKGVIDFPIGRSLKDRKKMAVTNKNSKNAVTHFKVLKRYGKFCYVELKLETGRTHQIRVHMSYIGHPLLGDLVYGPSKQPFELCGQTLHAKTLGFIHPSLNRYIEFESKLPDYFTAVLNKL